MTTVICMIYNCIITLDQGRNHVFKAGAWEVQFLGLGYYTEQNMDGIPSFVHCSVLRNGNHTHHQESWCGPSNFWGVRNPLPRPPSSCTLALDITQRPNQIRAMAISQDFFAVRHVLEEFANVLSRWR